MATRYCRSFGALLFLAPCCVLAQGEEDADLALAYGDKSFVSIATGSQQVLRRAPAVATVITAEDIAAMGAVDLDDVLETVPGMHVSRSSTSYAPLYLIRGIASPFNPQTLMLQNGVPMTTLFVGNRGNGWAGLPVENIARIEIIRGPGSALYGADAYSGVINIITKTAADAPGTEMGARVGSFATKDAWLQHADKLGPIDLAAFLRIGVTDGFKRTITADAQTRFDGLFGTRASLAPASVNTGRDAVDAGLDLAYEKWRMHVGYKGRALETAVGVAAALDPVGKQRTERIHADLSWTDAQFAKDWGLGFTASYLHYSQQYPAYSYLQLFPPGLTLPTGFFPNGMIAAPETWERQVRLSAFASYSGFADHKVRVGFGHDDLDLYKAVEHRNFSYTAGGTPIPLPTVIDFTDIAPFITPHRRTVGYIYAQDEWSFARDWTLTAGVRRDSFSDAGDTTNPRLALVWDATLDLTAKLLYGRAFRAPAFTEQYSITNPVARGNASLRPETISTLEAVFVWQARKDVQLNLSVFDYMMKDIIRSVTNATPGTGTTFNNTGDQSGRGAELEAIWDAGRNLRLSGHYAYQHSVDEAAGQDAGYAPRNHLYGRADWRFSSGWLLGAQVNYVADRKRPVGDIRPAIANYTTLDLTLRTDRGKGHWSFAASVRNLFDADVREPSQAPGLTIPNDLPMAPRALYIQAEYLI